MRIDHLTLRTAHLDSLYTFYAERLGLPLIERRETRFTVQAGHSRLSFDYMAEFEGAYHFAFDVPQNQIADAATWIESRAQVISFHDKIILQSGPRWNAHMLYFTDPAGNILELIARHNQSNTSHKAFSERSLLSISEIGITTDDVAATVACLTEQLGVGVYDGAGSDMFSAVGDEEGLLIVVKQGRIWFPESGIPASLSPAAISLSGVQHVILDPPPYYLLASTANIQHDSVPMLQFQR
jgi:catechol-2,3-dioxygenase